MQPECFFHALFEAYEDPALCVEIRRLNIEVDPATGRRPCTSAWYPITDQSLTAAYKTALLWKQKGDVYMGVLPRVGHGKTDTSVTQAGAIWCEIDGKDGGQAGSIELLRKSEVYEQYPPHIVIGSGGGVHCYWLLREVCFLPVSSASQFNMLQKRLCFAIGDHIWETPTTLSPCSPNSPYADPVSTNVSRILRVPGTMNHKRKAQVTIIETNPQAPRMSIGQWDSWLRPAPKPVYHKPKKSVDGQFRPLPRRTRDALDMGYSQGERYPALRSILRSARGVGWSEEALQILCSEFAMYNPGCQSSVMQSLITDTMKRIHPD